jgi:hypothetical protein
MAKEIIPQPKRGDVRTDNFGRIVCMAVADGYVMCRRPGCMPFVKSVKEWNAYPFASTAKEGQP